MHLQLFLHDDVVNSGISHIGPYLAGGIKAGLKLGLTKTMINNARQLSCRLLGHLSLARNILERFGWRPSAGRRPGARAPCPLNLASIINTSCCKNNRNC